MNPMMNVIMTVQKLKQDPQQLGQFLLDHNMIKQDQLEEVQGMGGDFGKVGNFLMNSGVMSQQQAQGMLGGVNQIQNMMR
ncbi:MAG: hypothetical protein IJP92_14185 [Lachnospiraceae bacterium]|nr:hypothetical protein [Lachnospiraceae bacterium]